VSEQKYRFAPITEAEARAIAEWRYVGPYAVYTTPEEDREAAAREMLDPRSPYFAVRDAAGHLVGFFAYGSAAEVGDLGAPHLLTADGMLSVGLGLRPDLTGNGRGPAFVEAGLAHARALWHPRIFRLYVLSFNRRAMRVYERVGFEPVGLLRVPYEGGEREFVEMRREA
jgi:[ribosomal protein S18]-alanine N-acetyltransferase